jgi:hypothetical protein
MGVDNTTDQESGHGQTVADLLHEDTGRSQSRTSDVLTSKVVYDGTDDLR